MEDQVGQARGGAPVRQTRRNGLMDRRSSARRFSSLKRFRQRQISQTGIEKGQRGGCQKRRARPKLTQKAANDGAKYKTHPKGGTCQTKCRRTFLLAGSDLQGWAFATEKVADPITRNDPRHKEQPKRAGHGEKQIVDPHSDQRCDQHNASSITVRKSAK